MIILIILKLGVRNVQIRHRVHAIKIDDSDHSKQQCR